MAKRNRRRNKRANRAERRAKRIQQKIRNIRKGGGNRKEARARVQALRARRNNAAAKARNVRKNIVKSGGTVRDRVQSKGVVARRTTPQSFRPKGKNYGNVITKTAPAPLVNAGQQTTVYSKNNNNKLSQFERNIAHLKKTGQYNAYIAARSGGGVKAPNQGSKRKGQFVNNKYDAGKKFNAADVRRMKAGGMSQKDIMQYAKNNNYTDTKAFQKMQQDRRGTFDKDGNYDYGKKFNAGDIGRMSASGMGTDSMREFIQNNESLQDNKFAQGWLKNNQGSGGTPVPGEITNEVDPGANGGVITPPAPPGGTVTPPGGTVTPPGGTVTPPGETVTPPGGTVTPPGENLVIPPDPELETDFTNSQEYLDLTNQIKNLQDQLNEYANKDLTTTDEISVIDDGLVEEGNLQVTPTPTTTPVPTPTPVSTAPTPTPTPNLPTSETGNLGVTSTTNTSTVNPWNSASAVDPLAWLKNYAAVGAPQAETPKTGAGGAPDLTEVPVSRDVPAVSDADPKSTTPYIYQPIGAEKLGEQNMILSRAGYSSGYNPSGAGNPYVNPINPFTARSQPVGTNGLPVYPGMTYGPGTAPITGQVTSSGTAVQTPMPATPSIPSDPAMKGAITPDKDGKYPQPSAPYIPKYDIKQPQYAYLNQLGM